MASNADARPPAANARPQPTRQLGKYRIEKQLGAGGMGTVYLAVDTQLRRTVALKVLPKERAANPQLVKRFKSEGTAAAKLEHENIVRVFDSGEIDGYLYLALEYIDGIDVQELVSKRDRLPVRRTIEIVAQVAAALQHAYERGIVHRDIKPSNLLIRKDGVVKLADMGLARAIDESTEAGITHAGMTVGTVDYISPEQGADSKRADIRSDLYSLGCSWYHMLTGEVPYPDGTATDRLRAHNMAAVPDPRRLNDRIPGAVVAVLQRLMAKRPEDRYQTPQELIDDLRQPRLLQRETGAADIAGLALAASDDLPASSRQDRRVSVSDIVDDEGDDARPRSDRSETRGKRKRGAAVAGDPSQGTKRLKRNAGGQAVPSELPRRSDRPEKFGVDQSTIDPDQLKLAGIGLLGLIVLSAVGWGIWQYIKTSGASLAPAGANPFAQNPSAESPEPPPVVSSRLPSNQRSHPPPAPSINTFRPESPFPGVNAQGDSSVADVPRWVYEERQHILTDPQVVVVDPGAPDGAQTAEEAYNRLPPAGGVIEFKGRGPHRIAGLSIASGSDVVLRAADGDSPVLLWDSDAASLDGGTVATTGGRLELNGLHVVASGHGRDASHTVLSVEDATLLIRNCSFTLADPATVSVPVIRLAHGIAGPSRCVLENVIVRGNNVSVALLEGPHQELVAGNCLFATGDAAVVTVLDPAAEGQGETQDGTSVQLLACLALSRNAIFQCDRQVSSPPPAVRLRTRHSLLIGDGSAAVALRFESWPEAPSGVLDQPRAVGVALASEKTAWLGWSQLTAFRAETGGNPVIVENEAQWLQFWRFPLSAVGGIAPATADRSPDYQTAAAATILARSAAAGSGLQQAEIPLNVADLPTIPEDLAARLVAIGSRPRVPADLEAAFSAQQIRIDLGKEGLKLNDRLNSADCPDGSRVVLTGSGTKLIEPVSLTGKSLRIEFLDGDKPLVVEPVKLSGANVERPAALFRVEGGRIDLINAQMRIPRSERTAYPLRLLEVVNGSFVVRNCQLYGQFGPGSLGTPTIEWRMTGADSTQFGLIEDSLITAQQRAVHAAYSGQLLEVRNSIVVSNGDLFHLFPAAADRRTTLHIANSTLAAAAAFFRISPPTDTGTAPGHLQGFVSQTVYGPPVGSSDGPVLLVQESQDQRQSGVDWWEQDVAISDRINRFRVAGDPATGVQDFTRVWLQSWGPEHIANAIYDPIGVLLLLKDIEPERTQPSDWELDGKSLAASAGPGGSPLGANTSAIGPHGVAPQAPGNAPVPGNKAPVPKGRRPAF